MSRLLGRFSASAVLAGALLAMAAAPAEATFMVRLSNAGSTTTIVDNNLPPGTGTDLDPMKGAILFTGSVGNYAINLDTSLSKPVVGSQPGGTADLRLTDSSQTFVAGAGSLVIEATDTDFTTSPPLNNLLQSFYTGNISPNFTASLQTFVDYTNTAFGEGGGTVTTGLQGPFGPSVTANAKEKNYLAPSTGPFSMTVRLTLTEVSGTGGGGQITGRGVVSNPEPATILPALASLPLVGLIGRKIRRRKQAEAA